MPVPLFLVRMTVLHQSPPQPPVWAKSAVSLAIREGLLGETQYGLYPYPTRGVRDGLGLALLFREAASKEASRFEAIERERGDGVDRASVLRCASLMRAFRWSNDEMHRLYGDAIPGTIDVSRLTALARQIEASAPARDRLFHDVPVDHWAAKAVGDLRALGLLDGYPDGKFRG